jgi:hypothetical protein
VKRVEHTSNSLKPSGLVSEYLSGGDIGDADVDDVVRRCCALDESAISIFDRKMNQIKLQKLNFYKNNVDIFPNRGGSRSWILRDFFPKWSFLKRET